MQKIYVLLRNEQQTGPYNLQELSQFRLKPYDLIWIEGQSAGWYYPQEIAALHPYLDFLPKKPAPSAPFVAKNTGVGLSPNHSEILPADPVPPPEKSSVSTFYSVQSTSGNLEKAVLEQFSRPDAGLASTAANAGLPKPKKTPGGVVLAVTVLLVLGSVFTASWILNRQPSNTGTVAEPIAEAPAKERIEPVVAAGNHTNHKTAIVANGQVQPKIKRAAVPITVAKTKVVNQAVVPEPPTGLSAGEATGNEIAGTKTPDDIEPVTTSAPAEETPADSGKKKQTVKERFLDLFRKKPEEKSERTYSRRETATNLAQLVHVRFEVPNDWMMGIKGAKATLVNRNNEKIRSATVEVMYYNDKEELLQTKLVTFGKIDAKESAVLSIPDHPTATRLDYRVLSVTGNGQPPA